MTVIELAMAFAGAAPVGIVITDARLNPPGPIILYANEAFGRLTGRSIHESVGQSRRLIERLSLGAREGRTLPWLSDELS